MRLLEHTLWNHGDVCYDLDQKVSCPDGCTQSYNRTRHLYCDMRWPRLTLYQEKDENASTDGKTVYKEKRYPCRVPEGKLIFVLTI